MLQDQSPNRNVDRALFESSFRKELTGLVATGCRTDEQIAREELLSLDRPVGGVERSNIEL